jgi:hypothetical protein
LPEALACPEFHGGKKLDFAAIIVRGERDGIELLPPYKAEFGMANLSGRRVIVRGVFCGRVNMSEGSLSEISDLRAFDPGTTGR